MAYQLEVYSWAKKDFEKARKSGAPGLKKLFIEILEHPRRKGRPLGGVLKDFMKARSDPFRIAFKIDDENKKIILMAISTRDDVYIELEEYIKNHS